MTARAVELTVAVEAVALTRVVAFRTAVSTTTFVPVIGSMTALFDGRLVTLRASVREGERRCEAMLAQI